VDDVDSDIHTNDRSRDDDQQRPACSDECRDVISVSQLGVSTPKVDEGHGKSHPPRSRIVDYCRDLRDGIWTEHNAVLTEPASNGTAAVDVNEVRRLLLDDLLCAHDHKYRFGVWNPGQSRSKYARHSRRFARGVADVVSLLSFNEEPAALHPDLLACVMLAVEDEDATRPHDDMVDIRILDPDGDRVKDVPPRGQSAERGRDESLTRGARVPGAIIPMNR
jgi:hypothetical protein